MKALLVLVALVAGLAAAEPLPVLPAGRIELHGRLHVEGGAAAAPVWLRLAEPEARFAGGRMLELVWEPPPAAALDGAVLADCPFVLLDQHGRVRAWNGRHTLSQAEPAGAGYRVVRGVVEGEGIAAHEVGLERTLPGPRAWDRRLAPVLLALAWRPDTAAAVPVVDLFGALPATELSWRGEAVRCGAAVWRVQAGRDGRLQRLTDGDGRVLLALDPPGP